MVTVGLLLARLVRDARPEPGDLPASAQSSRGRDRGRAEVLGRDDFAGAFAAAIRERMEAVIVVSSRLMTLNRARILGLAGQNRLLLVSGYGPWAAGGPPELRARS